MARVVPYLLTEIWYPGPPGTGPFPQRPGGQPNAPLADGVANLPLVMFSHGSCGFQEQSLFLTPLFASHGFIVAAPPHPGNTTGDILTCGTPAATSDSFDNVLRYAIPFLTRWLAGDGHFDGFLEPRSRPSGLVLTSDVTG